MPSRLDDELRRLVSAGVLRPYQAEALRLAAEADAELGPDDTDADWSNAGLSVPAWTIASGSTPDEEPSGGATRTRRRVGPTRPSVLVEVLGYVCGALLLGAVVLLTVANWGEMGRAARISTAAGAAVALLGAAVGMAVFQGRNRLSSALASVGCCVAGFALYVVVEAGPGRIAGVAFALVLAGLALWRLTGSSVLMATAAILAAGVPVVVNDVVGSDGGTRTNTAGLAGTGFILVALVLAALGLVRDQATAWSLAGAAVFSSCMCWLVQSRGEVMALAVGTAGSAALLVAYGRRRTSAYAMVGCAILLVIWPIALYQLTDNLAGVAIGLVVASGVLLVAVLLLARRQRRGTG